MKKIISTVFAAGLILATGAPAFADVIEGNWKEPGKETVGVSKCGGSFCFTVKTGTHAGKQIGKLKGSAGNYTGTLTDPEDGKVYSGSAKVNGSKMNLKGCALKIFCQTRKFNRL